MTSVLPRYRHGPVTFTVNAAATITGGMLVESDGASPALVRPASAASQVCLGVATTDGVGASVSQTFTLPGSPPTVNAGTYPNFVAVDCTGVYPLTYTAAATFGARLKCAANGQVTPWVSGTDNAELIVGICYEPSGVGIGAVGATRLALMGS
jgi:hypothetical protein